MGIIKEDSIMELGRMVFSLFIRDKVVCILPWPEDCLRKISRALAPPGILAVPCEFARIAAMAAFAPAIMKMNGPVVSSIPFLLSSGLELSFHLVGGLEINIVTEHE